MKGRKERKVTRQKGCQKRKGKMVVKKGKEKMKEDKKGGKKITCSNSNYDLLIYRLNYFSCKRLTSPHCDNPAHPLLH